MKILLLTDLPPCDDYTAGLVLMAMARFVPKDSLACFAVVNPTIPVHMAPEFSGVPIEFHVKPNENWAWIPRRRPLARLASGIVHVGERLTERFAVDPLIQKAVHFGREQEVDRVWAVLEGQTMIRMAAPVAEQLDVPLHTHVWDPFSWWAKANKVDGPTTRAVQARFDRAISNSKSVATASQPMADIYRKRFGADAVPVIASHAHSLAKTPPPSPASEDTLLIGMAGQFYSASEWLSLVKALDAAGWRVGGRNVQIVVMGPQVPPAMNERRITFLGWKTQAQAAEILSCCDLLYCPYPFDPSMKEVSQFSFPSKLVLYLAAGRPIVFHGPDYSAPAAYVRDKGCGVIADQPFATSIFNAIERLVTAPDLYSASAKNAQAAFVADFTLQSMQRALTKFLDFEAPTDSVAIYDHRAEAGSRSFPERLSETVRCRSAPMFVLNSGRRVRGIYRGLRRRSVSAATGLALKIPRLRVLKQEIHALYVDNAELRRRLTHALDEIESLTGSRQRDMASTQAHAPKDLEGLEALNLPPWDEARGYLDRRELKDPTATTHYKTGEAGEDRHFHLGFSRDRVLLIGKGRSVRHFLSADGAAAHLSGDAEEWVGMLLEIGESDGSRSHVERIDLRMDSTEAAQSGGERDERILRTRLLRLALQTRCEEIAVAGFEPLDTLVREAIDISDLLKRPLLIATQSAISMPNDADLPETVRHQRLQSVGEACNASVSAEM